jgi:tripartite-type tricarboxylate transporter receptor subunit TctC
MILRIFRTRYIALVAFLAVSTGVLAQNYPARPIRIIVPFPAGGAIDLQARVIGQKLNERWNVPVVVDNRPGAATIVGTEVAAKAPPDGYTLLMITTAFAINPTLYGKIPYDPADFTPVIQTGTSPLLLAAHPSLPAKTFRELVALAKQRPDQITYASAGTGTAAHVAVELMNSMAGMKLVHIPYRGLSQAFTEVLAGQVSLMITSTFALMPYVKSGKLKALAVTTPKRTAAAPEVPTVAESGVPGYEASVWQGVATNAGTPADIVAKVNREINTIFTLADVKEKLGSDGAVMAANTPEQFAAHIRKETQKWARVIKDSGAKPE